MVFLSEWRRSLYLGRVLNVPNVLEKAVPMAFQVVSSRRISSPENFMWSRLDRNWVWCNQCFVGFKMGNNLVVLL